MTSEGILRALRLHRCAQQAQAHQKPSMRPARLDNCSVAAELAATFMAARH
jgi:hypothetical protein